MQTIYIKKPVFHMQKLLKNCLVGNQIIIRFSCKTFQSEYLERHTLDPVILNDSNNNGGG